MRNRPISTASAWCTPVFFMKDPLKFTDFIHTQKREARSNRKSPTMMWDYWSLNPESLHQVTILMSDRGTPYRHMHGYGSHTFSLINDANERTWGKFHFRTNQGVKNFSNDDATMMKASRCRLRPARLGGRHRQR